MRDFAQYVHAHRGRWIVAVYREGRYEAPMTAEACRLTGCHTIYGSLDYVMGNAYTYRRRSDALRRAHQIYS